jgi:hypothetical protein
LNAASVETVLAIIQASFQVGHGVTGFTGSSPFTIQARRDARKGRAAKKRPRVRELDRGAPVAKTVGKVTRLHLRADLVYTVVWRPVEVLRVVVPRRQGISERGQGRVATKGRRLR